MPGHAKVMVVEDDPLIALDLEDTLTEAGYDVTGTAASVDAGLAMIEREPPQAATLDYQLGRETSERIAAELDARRIPYCFVSGRGDLIESGEHPVIAKPAAPSTVLRALGRLLHAGGPSPR